METEAFAEGLIPAPMRPAIHELLDVLLAEGLRWPALPEPLRTELHRFDSQTFAAAFARIQGGNAGAIASRQDFLVRTAVTSLLFPLEDFEEQLLAILAERGLPSMFHHVVHEMAKLPGARDAVLNAGERCRIAVFALEDVLLDTRIEPVTAATLLKRRDLITRHLIEHVELEAVPFGANGLALLWVTACFGLGGLENQSTTQGY